MIALIRNAIFKALLDSRAGKIFQFHFSKKRNK